jgi:hypothetical protein
MDRKRVASIILAAASTVGTTVITMVVPSIKPEIGFPILVGCGTMAIGAVGLWLWPNKQTFALDVHPEYAAELARQKAISDTKAKHAFEMAKGEIDARAWLASLQPSISGKSIWVPLHEALNYLVYESDWAFRRKLPENKREFDKIVSDEFLEALARGEIQSRGKKGKGFSNDNSTTESIPVDYWITAFIQPHGEIVLASENQGAAGNPKLGYTYRNIVIDMASVKQRWPKSQSIGLSPVAQFCEPLRNTLAAEKAQKQTA